MCQGRALVIRAYSTAFEIGYHPELTHTEHTCI